MLQISGYWLLLTSLVHVLGGLWLFAEPLAEIAGNGWFNAVAPDPFNPYFDREDAFWFMMATPSIFTAGLLCFWAQAKQFPLPSFLGWILLTTATVGCLIEPISGLWLLIPPGFLILAASRK